jgi:F0F1-type ATP synthase delta subunit
MITKMDVFDFIFGQPTRGQNVRKCLETILREDPQAPLEEILAQAKKNVENERKEGIA